MSHDEYTDYSCSTSVERLARDVESLLRSWHLVGSDRHVSFQQQGIKRSLSSDEAAAAGAAATAAQQKGIKVWSSSEKENRKTPRTEPVLELHDDKIINTFADNERTALKRKPSERSQVQLIRTHHVEWTVSKATGGKVTLTLVLDLWDGPSAESGSSLSSVLSVPNNLAGYDMPLSLTRAPLEEMPPDCFRDISTMMGIGQHITLCLKSGQDTEEVVRALGPSIVQRHDDKVAPWMLTSVLSGIFQTALQWALANIQCTIPAFGIWGTYTPTHHRDEEVQQPPFIPKWLQLENRSFGRRPLFRSTDHLNRSTTPPLIKSSMLTGTQFWLGFMPVRRDEPTRVTSWGNMLLQHTSSETVLLCGAMHDYEWRKDATMLSRSSVRLRKNQANDWRQEKLLLKDESTHSVLEYQQKCRQYATELIEQFAGTSPSEPLWGPVDDPLKAVHVKVTWNSKFHEDGSIDPILTMPLKSRQQGMTKSDRIEMEETVERSILDPVNAPNFSVEIEEDKKSSSVNLSAINRLLLAGMIRTAILPETTLMHQLTDEFEMEAFASHENEAQIDELLNRAGVGAVTRRLVIASDWETLSEEMISGKKAELIVGEVMDGSLSMGFPSPPDEAFADPVGTAASGLFSALPKSAPAGRLLSMLFVNMSRLRSPASMAMVWTYFVHDLRNRYYSRTNLPNMGYVPGLDPPLELMNEKQCMSTSGLRVKAENAAFVHCSEPQPDDSYCLIGQKLQVFNIGIESLVATDAYNATRLDRSFHDGEETAQLQSNNSGGRSFDVVDQLPSLAYPKDTSFVSTMERDEEKNEDDRSGSQFEFFDAVEAGSQESLPLEGDLYGSKSHRSHASRKGARCPVYGVTLIETCDQLYAPYLRRPFPWTDDTILEQKILLSAKSRKSSFRDRLEIAHRLLKPKLLSDMRAFKAANNSATFQDFVNWYGNPGNTLEEFEEATSTESVAVKLDRAAEAIKVLNLTRDFWSATWDEATPLPAIDQPPLFDNLTTIEMVLDNLETIHPASLLNQVTAVNLAMSYFSMVSTADEAMLVSSVVSSFKQLRMKVEAALGFLSRDAARGTIMDHAPVSLERLPRHASLESIRACEDACNAMSDTEVLLSKAMSLLHKFPDQFDFVDSLLQRREEGATRVESLQCRQAILGAIQKQHQSTLTIPSRRNYILRNKDEQNPCQLCVRYGEGVAFYNDKEGGLLVALTKSEKSN